MKVASRFWLFVGHASSCQPAFEPAFSMPGEVGTEGEPCSPGQAKACPTQPEQQFYVNAGIACPHEVRR